MVELYDFVKKVPHIKFKNPKTLNTFLEQKGYVKGASSAFKLMRLDLQAEEKAKAIEFKSDGVYLTKNGIEYKGYMYLKKYSIHYNGEVKFPKFHITRCSTVLEIDQRKDFVWHNSNEAQIQDKNSGVLYNQTLQLCQNCRKETLSGINSTQDFYDTLDKSETQKTDVLLDLNGYIKGWQGNSGISKKYRMTQNFTCENCKIKMEGLDTRFMQTDHIDGNKLNNPVDGSNYSCLCILCHSYKDQHHIKRFAKGRNKRELKSFVEKYREELRTKQNKYLNQYDTDNK